MSASLTCLVLLMPGANRSAHSSPISLGSPPHHKRSFPSIFGTILCVIFEAPSAITERNECWWLQIASSFLWLWVVSLGFLLVISWMPKLFASAVQDCIGALTSFIIETAGQRSVMNTLSRHWVFVADSCPARSQIQTLWIRFQSLCELA